MGTPGVFNGRLIGIWVGGIFQAFSKSHTLTINAAEMDITSKDSISWKGILPTVKDWSISCDGLVVLESTANADKVLDLLIAGTEVQVKFTTNISGDKYWYGQAYVTSVEMSAPMDEPVSYSCTFVGNGTLTSVQKT